ncbi:WD40/YVTN repeat-like-containing protein [Cryptosporidium felis]|nr:WD40/YVTN repeat-like-containing protein [Cryptosporidium felis]
MEILTHDDTESIRFIHGPKLKIGDYKNVKILVCNPLKYLIFVNNSQITLYDLNTVMEILEVSRDIENDCELLKPAQKKIIEFHVKITKIIKIILDYSSTILIIVTDTKILLFNLLDPNQNKELSSIEHNGIQSLISTQENDIVTLDVNGSCFLYRFTNCYSKFTKIRLLLEDNSDNFKLIETCPLNSLKIHFILFSENKKGIILITRELYDKIDPANSNSFIIPNSHYHLMPALIEPIIDIFSSIGSSTEEILGLLHVASIKFLDGKNTFLSVVLIGGRGYVDAYTLFFLIENHKNIKICFYSINDLSFDNFDTSSSELSKVQCVAIWVSEWGVLFIGSCFFSQMVVFTCNNLLIDVGDFQDNLSNNWIRLGMCEGYDINCTDFDVGISDACICTCYSNTIKDQKLSIDNTPVVDPPIIILYETTGSVVFHYIGGKFNLPKPKCILGKSSSIEISNVHISGDDRIEVFPKYRIPGENSTVFVEPFERPNNPKETSIIERSPKEKIIESIPKLRKNYSNNFSGEIYKTVDKSEKSLIESISKMESHVVNLEDSLCDLITKIKNAISIPGISIIKAYCIFVTENRSGDEEDDFDRLIESFVYTVNSDFQLRKLHFSLMKKFSDEIYSNTSIELLRDKLRSNKLTSNQISILFQCDFESNNRNISVNNGVEQVSTSLKLIEKRSLKIASRISQVSTFCRRLTSRKNKEFDIFFLPPRSIQFIDTSTDSAHSPKKSFLSTKDDEVILESVTSDVKLIKKNGTYSQLENANVFHFSPTANRFSHLSDVIKNIKNSISDDSVSPFVRNFELNNTERTEFTFEDSTKCQTNQHRYVQLRSKLKNSDKKSNIYLETRDCVHKEINRKNSPYFHVLWTPGSVRQSSTQLDKFSNYFNGPSSPNLPVNSSDNINFIISNCHERLERIIDFCKIAEGSISFIKREGLVPIQTNFKSKKPEKSMDKRVGLSSSDRVMVFQLLLARTSTLQKNMIYRQRLSTILSNCQSEYETKTNSHIFISRKASVNRNVIPHLSSKIENKNFVTDLINNRTEESVQIISKDKNLDSYKSFSYSIPAYSKCQTPENEIDFALSKENPQEFSYISPGTCERGTFNASLNSNDIDPVDKFGAIQLKIAGRNGKDEGSGPFCASHELADRNNEVSIPYNGIEYNQVLEETINSEAKLCNDFSSLLFPLNMANNETPNSKKASEGIFTFSTEMNITLNLPNVLDHKDEQASNESNIFSFSTDSNPLKPISSLIPLTKNTIENEIKSSPVSLKKIVEDSQPKPSVNIDFSSSSEIKNQNTAAPGGKSETFERGENCTGSVVRSNLGGPFGFPNISANTTQAPKTSGFGMSQYITNGPFSSKKSDDLPSHDLNINQMKVDTPNKNSFFGAHDPTTSTSTGSQLSIQTPLNGFTQFSQDFQGFSLNNIQSSKASFSVKNETARFNFAPPQKPRQVNKLE